MAKPVEFHWAAAAELESAFDWYLEKDVQVASGFLDEVSRGIELIVAAPERWPLYQGNIRKFVLRRFPFLIMYREQAAAIQIIALAHARRRPDYWKRRV